MENKTRGAKVLAFALALIMLIGIVPMQAFAQTIDDPLDATTGTGWEDFGGDTEIVTSTSPTIEEDIDKNNDFSDGNNYSDESNSSDHFDAVDDKELIKTEKVQTTTLGSSGNDGMLPWAANLASVHKQHKSSRMGNATGISTTALTWGSGNITFGNGAWVGSGYVFKISHSAGEAFCGEFNGQTAGGTYRNDGEGTNSRIRQIIANYDASGGGDNAYITAQILIWAELLGTTVNWNGFPVDSTVANGSADASQYKYYKQTNTSSTHTQNILTWKKGTETTSDFQILKKNADGSQVLAGAKFTVDGPGGFRYTGTTDSQGVINVPITASGTYHVTETDPPAGYLLSSTPTQTVEVTVGTPAVVEFRNEKNPNEDEEGKKIRIEVEVEVTSEEESFNEKEFEYTDALGQITIRKHDQDGNSLDGALFHIRVDFSDGTHIEVDNWEVDNGARLFTWTHPENNKEPATVTVTEVQPPRYYEGDPTPKVAIVHPTYTRVILQKSWKTTFFSYFYHYTVFEIDASGNEVEIETYDIRDEQTETTSPIIERFVDFVEGDRETTVTFVNRRKTGDIIVTKRDANTGEPLAGATIHLWGEDLGNPQHVDKTLVTGPNGEAVFEHLPPGTYAIQETQAPFGYNGNDEIQNAVLQSGEVIHKEVRNYKKDGLFIKKVDEHGKPLAGATFELRRGSGEVLIREVTDENGLIYRGYLTDDTYVVEEIAAPDGYLLDANPIQSIRIYSSDDNKEYTLSFVNKKKPAIEITKVDEADPTLKLEGAVFRITNSQTGQYSDVTTGPDGTAKLEHLQIGTTYIIEETGAPEGYLNSGYRKEIVLEESRTYTVTVKNNKQPNLTITKKDKKTGETLSGATLRVSWNSGSDFRDVTTGADGTAVLDGLSAGWYTVTEIAAPEGYLLDSTPHQILIKAGEEAAIEIFNEAKPSLTLLKVDNITKNPLQYARFKIEQKTDTGTIFVGEYVSDENGIVHLENIEPGRYVITEIEPPSGYNIDVQKYDITIEYGQAYKLEITNTPKSPIYIEKVDEEGNALRGAKFKVTTMNGGMVGTVTTGLTGYAVIPYAEPGWYVVEEIQAPDGYILNNTPINVEVKSGIPATVQFVNEKQPTLEILKVDDSTGKALMGATFKVTKANGEFVGEYTTGGDGLAILTGLSTGSYVVSELRSPDGYILDPTPKIVQLDSGATIRLTFTNIGKPGLQIAKKDKLTGSPIAGARFQIVQLVDGGAKKDLGQFTSGDNGLIYVSELAVGNYVITETQAALGYILDPTPQNIFVEGGKLNTVEFFNMPYSTLQLLKIDSETRLPLENAVFKLFDERRIEIGTYTTTALGEILIPELNAGIYYLQEVKAPAGYVLDSTVRKIELFGGKTTTVEIKNTELGSLRIIKVDDETGKPLAGATFNLYDRKNNLLGEFTTNQDGIITFGRNLQEGTYKIKEIKAPEGYVLDDSLKSITIKAGETTEFRVENTLKQGRIMITKEAGADNSITKDKTGATLKDVEFEIYDNQMNLVDTITTDSNGVATSDYLPLGVYGIKEVKSAKYYFTDGKMFYADIKVHDDLIKFTVKNEPVHIETSVTKRGNEEVQAGDSMYYDFSDIENKSNVPLEEFYIHDVLPTDAVRLETIWTGVWNERVKFDVQIETNKKPTYRTVKTGLLSTNNNEIDMSPSALSLGGGEYVTEFKIVFKQPVDPGFKCTTGPKIKVKTLELKDSKDKLIQFTNKVDVGGRYLTEWTYSTDGWTVTMWNVPKGDLPKTGFEPEEQQK